MKFKSRAMEGRAYLKEKNSSSWSGIAHEYTFLRKVGWSKIPFWLEGKFSEKLISIWMEALRKDDTALINKFHENIYVPYIKDSSQILTFPLIWFSFGYRARLRRSFWERKYFSMKRIQSMPSIFISFHEHSLCFPYQYVYNCISQQNIIFSIEGSMVEAHDWKVSWSSSKLNGEKKFSIN